MLKLSVDETRGVWALADRLGLKADDDLTLSRDRKDNLLALVESLDTIYNVTLIGSVHKAGSYPVGDVA